MATPTLWQFKHSHYNEKVRWALDFKGIPHRRVSLLPGPHAFSLLPRTGQSATPVLEHDGNWLADSTRIIETLERQYPDPPLYPSDPADRTRAIAFEEYFDEKLGPALRLAWFFEIFKDPDYVAKQLSIGFGAIEQSLYSMSFGLVKRVMTAAMSITAENAPKARATVMETLDRLEAELQPSGYLVGDSFTIADLTAAALWTPVTMPAEFPYPMIKPVPADAARWREELLERRGVQWALEIYRRHRGKSSEVA